MFDAVVFVCFPAGVFAELPLVPGFFGIPGANRRPPECPFDWQQQT